MAKDYAALLAEVEELDLFFRSLPLVQQYNFFRQMRGEQQLSSGPQWRRMVMIAQRIKKECGVERRKQVGLKP
jgi:hypothetical protein